MSVNNVDIAASAIVQHHCKHHNADTITGDAVGSALLLAVASVLHCW